MQFLSTMNFAFARHVLKALALSACLLSATAQTIVYSPPRFADSDRLLRLQPVLPEIDRVFREQAEKEKFPGLVYGIVLDGTLIHTGAVGFANLELKVPAGADIAFRIASMSKSFITLSIFKLRDDGKLHLDDPVWKYVPEFRKVRPPTKDSPEVTVRNLMSMAGGLPEDNPWGDRQMGISKEALRDFVKEGLSFSNPPGQEYEYSNLGFVLLGQVVTKAARMPFQRYIAENIFRPLGMNHTGWEYANYRPDKFALGYRWEHEAWKLEPILHDGDGAACGGIITTIDDFAKYVAMHLDAWPARDDAETGPVRRSTLRELHKPLTFRSLNPTPQVSFYGYGLGWTVDGRGVVALAHSGGLPGYGSYYRFLPNYGLGIIGFANRTYASVNPPVEKAINLLLEKGGLQPREVTTSPILQTRKDQVADWIVSWDEKLGEQIAAENFFLDKSREDWVTITGEVFAKAGKITAVGPMHPFNQLRGRFEMQAEHGVVNVFFTLTPEKEPKVQELNVSFAAKN